MYFPYLKASTWLLTLVLPWPLVRGKIFVCLNKMFYEHTLDADESGSMYWLVHYTGTLNYWKLDFYLEIYINTLKNRKKRMHRK